MLHTRSSALKKGSPIWLPYRHERNSCEAASSTYGMVVCASTHSKQPLSEKAAAQTVCRLIHCVAVLMPSDTHRIWNPSIKGLSH